MRRPVTRVEGEDEGVQRDAAPFDVSPGERVPARGELQRRGLRPRLWRPASGVVQVREGNRLSLIDGERVIAADAWLIPGLHVGAVADPDRVSASCCNVERVCHRIARGVDSSGCLVPA